jgi:tetratricopeptide (TPR) repeat protein
MPRRNKVQVNFQTAAGDVVFPAPRYEHRIAVYPDAELELLHQWYGDRTDEESAARRQQLGTELHEHWKQFGDTLRAEHRWIAAIDAYRTALRYLDSGEVRASLADVEERNRKCVVLWFDGIHHKQQRRLDEAIATFQSLLAIQPDSAKAHYELGTLYAAVNRRPQALSHLELARQLDPNDPGPEVMLGWLDFLDGRPAPALEHYLAARQIEPWSERIEHMVGQCLAKLGRWEDAAQAYQQALTIDPHCGDAALALRGVLRERLAPVDALSRAVSAVKATSGQDAGLLLTLAEIYRDLGRDSEALQTLAVARDAASGSNSSLLPQIQNLDEAISKSRPR